MKREYTKQKAKTLLDRIKKYWASEGYLVEGKIEPIGYNAVMRETMYEIRTNLHNGLPTQRVG